jgi:acetyl/propionyl-CoA carboxylase alpha subunit
MVKAAAGGGGRGMRLVHAAERLCRTPLAMPAPEAEAPLRLGSAASWKRQWSRPRHVEIQVLADAAWHGAASGRARLFGAAPPPEGDRGSARARS